MFLILAASLAFGDTFTVTNKTPFVVTKRIDCPCLACRCNGCACGDKCESTVKQSLTVAPVKTDGIVYKLNRVKQRNGQWKTYYVPIPRAVVDVNGVVTRTPEPTGCYTINGMTICPNYRR